MLDDVHPQRFQCFATSVVSLSDHRSLGMYPRSSYTELEERRLETETSLLKTYLLEAHSENTGQRDILRLLLQNGSWPGKVG